MNDQNHSAETPELKEEQYKGFFNKGSQNYDFYKNALLQILIAFIIATPSYIAFYNIPYIYYDIKTIAALPIPWVDKDKYIKLLKENEMPLAAMRIRIINKGEISAKKVKIGANNNTNSNSKNTNAKFISIKTDPSSSLNSTFVEITKKLEEGDSFVILDNLPIDRKVIVYFGYTPIEAIPNIEVVFNYSDNKEIATKTENIDNSMGLYLKYAFKCIVVMFILLLIQYVYSYLTSESLTIFDCYKSMKNINLKKLTGLFRSSDNSPDETNNIAK